MRPSLLFFFIFSLLAHGSSQECSISNLIVEQQSCLNGSFLVDIDFNVENPESNMFGVVGNATDYGFFSYAELPVTLGPLEGDGETEWEFIVYDMEEPNCQATFALGIVTCCEIFDVAVDPLECDSDETYSAVINFNMTNTGELGFDVYDVNETFLGFFFYEDLPVTVSGIISSGFGEDYIIICDNDDPNCCTTVQIEGPDCDPTDCEIYGLTAELTECDQEQVFVILNFITENVGNDFTVVGNGNNYGEFTYEEVPIQLGPFPGDGSELEFAVIDGDNVGCSDFVVIETPVCPEACGFRDVVIEPASCLSDTVYTIDLEFVPVSVNDSGFTLFAGVESIGSFSYDSLPILGVPYPASGDFFDTLVLCDNIDPECCDTVQFQALLCEQCVIYDMTVATSECDVNDQFTVEIDFEFQNVGENGFQIGGNGMIYGTYQYEDLPITLGPLDGDDSTFWEFAVFDQDNPFCIQGVELGVINCINPCSIDNLQVTTQNCTGDGFYRVIVDFEFENGDTTGFNVFAGASFLGNYNYENLPIIIDSFPASGNDNDIIRVEDGADEICADILEFAAPDCFLTCDIRDIIVAPLECTSDSTFSALVSFIFENLETDFVDIYSDGEYLGFFNVNDLPIMIDGFRSSFFDVDIEICANDNELCCESRTFQGLECDTTCEVEGLVADLTECAENGTYDAAINFDPVGFTSMNARVTVNEGEPQLFPVNDLPVILEALPADGEPVLVVVCDNDNLDCCDAIVFDAPECVVDTCDIRDVVFSEFECQGDGTYNGTLNFIHEGLISSFVNISLGDSPIGIYPVDSIPLLLEGLPGNGAGAVLVICDNDNPDCCAEYEFTAPECEPECNVLGLATENVECLGNGTFAVTVSFEAQGFENALADVFYDGELIETISAEVGMIRIDGLEGDGGDVEITVCENDNSECCSTVTFSTPVCEGCDITSFSVMANECTSDSTFSAWIEYGIVGIDTAGITVYANGNFVGQFPAISPLLVSGLPANGENIVVEICGQDTLRSLPCCAEQEIEPLFCEDPGCPIIAVSVEATECDSNGTFDAILDAELGGDPTGAFIVAGNGTTYGSFSYNDLPLTIDSLEGDGETEWEFIIIDISDPTCSGSVDLGIINCDPSGLLGPLSHANQLSIRYRSGQPFVFVPDEAMTMQIWDAHGRMLTQVRDMTIDQVVELTPYCRVSGVFVVTFRGEHDLYVGRFVVAEN